jgi:hypothetical protein
MPSRPFFASEMERRVAKILLDLGFSVETGQQIGGYEPDLIAMTPDGRKVVVEIKGWAADSTHIERAKRQVELYKKALGADAGIVVLPYLGTSFPNEGVFSVQELGRLTTALALLMQSSKAQPAGAVRTGGPSERTVFAAMPFAPEFDDVFFVAMTYAAQSVDAVCKRIDKEDFSGDIVSELKALIEKSVAVVADLSGARPNVLFELGYAQGIPRPTVQISSTSLDSLPFDVRNWSVISYVAGQTTLLREPLSKRLKAVLEGG